MAILRNKGDLFCGFRTAVFGTNGGQNEIFGFKNFRFKKMTAINSIEMQNNRKFFLIAISIFIQSPVVRIHLSLFLFSYIGSIEHIIETFFDFIGCRNRP